MQEGRESARRIQCTDNLKQIGVALHNHYAANNAFAIGCIARPNANTNVTSPGWGWASALLPYLEQQPLYASTNIDLPIEDPINLAVRTTAMSAFVCPIDRFTGRFTIADANNQPIADAQTNSYASNFARDVNIAKNPGSGDGMFVRNLAITLAQVTDGASQTIIFGERGSVLTQVPWAGAINGGICRVTPGSPSLSTRTKTAPVQLLGRADTNGGTSKDLFFDPDDFYSPHPAGLNFLLCDGSIRFIKTSVSSAAYGDLCSRNLGEVVSGDGH